jgi:hypothetical protein
MLATLAVGFVGCSGQDGHARQARALTHQELLETACGDLRSQLEATANIAGLRDPAPSMLRPAATEHRLELSSRRMIAILKSGEPELLHLEPMIGPTIEAATRSLRRFQAELPQRYPHNPSQALKLIAAFGVLPLPFVRACFSRARAIGGETPA